MGSPAFPVTRRADYSADCRPLEHGIGRCRLPERQNVGAGGTVPGWLWPKPSADRLADGYCSHCGLELLAWRKDHLRDRDCADGSADRRAMGGAAIGWWFDR